MESREMRICSILCTEHVKKVAQKSTKVKLKNGKYEVGCLQRQCFTQA
jgi:hypothetical protein